MSDLPVTDAELNDRQNACQHTSWASVGTLPVSTDKGQLIISVVLFCPACGKSRIQFHQLTTGQNTKPEEGQVVKP